MSNDIRTMFQLNGQPSGLRYEPAFISADEHQQLIENVQCLNLQPFQFGAFEGKRRVAWFGWKFDYSDGSSNPQRTFPRGSRFTWPGSRSLTILHPEQSDKFS